MTEDFDDIYDKMMEEDVSEQHVKETDTPTAPVNNDVYDKQDDTESSNERIFAESRDDVNNDIEFSLDLLREGTKNITSVIINLNSLRQRIVDANNKFKAMSIKLKGFINARRGSEYEALANDLRVRIKNKDDKYAVVKGKLAELEKKHALLENQIEFNLDSIKTIDSILMGTKHVMDSEHTFGTIMYKYRKR